MSEWAMKRFWSMVSVDEVADGFTVQLDGRSVKTPAKVLFVVPTKAFADLVAAEWDAQDETVDPATMPFTRLANSAIDNVSLNQSAVADMLAEYGQSDLLCYRAEAPDELIERQAAAWDPLLDWSAKTFGVRLATGTGVMFVAQPEAGVKALSDQVHALSPFQLSAFHDLVTISGSLVVALAAARGAQSCEALWSASRIDEDWQIEQWGQDDEAESVAAAKRAAFQVAFDAFHALT